MKIKKLLVSMLAAILIITALPGTALAASSFTPKSASGYAPAESNGIPKYYYCYSGGTSERCVADMTYGNDAVPIFIDAKIYIRVIDGSMRIQNIKYDDFGVVEGSFRVNPDLFAIKSMRAGYRIKTKTIVTLVIA